MPENTTVGTDVESDEQNIEYVANSSARTAVLGRLVDGPAEPSAIATERSASILSAESNTNSLSVATAETAAENLREQGLVELLVTDEKRAYGLTAEGERVLFVLEQAGEL